MFDKKKDIDIKELNQIIILSKKVLKVVYIMTLFVGIYLFIRIGKELKIFNGFLTLLRIVSPLFIGMIIAWLFNPIVGFLQKHKIRRSLGTFIVYFFLILFIFVILISLVPSLYKQINDFVSTIPSIYEGFKKWFDDLFLSLDRITGIDGLKIENEILTKLSKYGTHFAEELPSTIVKVISSFFSGIGTLIISLIIGFFFLVGFESSDALIDFLPKKLQGNTRELLSDIDCACRNFVSGSIVDCTFIFIITSIGLWFVGLKAPLLFGLFCGITNIIPYLGPYIGGIPAVIVGFSQNTTIGILSLAVIFIIQTLEGNLLQPLILSKTTKLHPVTIMLGLLIFGYFFGIIGMVISTPLIAAFKAIILFFDKKYDILKFN